MLERRPHLVNWEVVCQDKNSGGLGIKKLSILNKAFFVNGVGALCRKQMPFRIF